MVKNVWITLCSSGMGGAERRALKLTIFLSRETSYNVNLIVNRELFLYLKNDVQINQAIVNKEFKIYIAEEYASKRVNYKYYFGVLKKVDSKHTLLSKVPFIYKAILSYFSYKSLFANLPIKQDDIIHCFGTDAARLGVLLNGSLNKNKVVIELVGNKFLSRFSHHLKLIGIRNKNIVFKAVSKTVLDKFNIFLERDNIKMNNKVSEWDGPFIYFFNSDVSQIKKENVIVFASRFNPPKNPVLFSNTIKKLFDNKTLNNWRVIIRGRGALETEIIEILSQYIEDGKVDVGFSGELYKDFALAKIIVSVIETGNYPSQSLFEAMSYGLIPVISKTGNSIEKYNHEEVVFCELDQDDLQKKITELVIKFEKDDDYYRSSSEKIQSFSKDLTNKSNYINEVFKIYG